MSEQNLSGEPASESVATAAKAVAILLAAATLAVVALWLMTEIGALVVLIIGLLVGFIIASWIALGPTEDQNPMHVEWDGAQS